MSAATGPQTYKNIEVEDPSEVVWVFAMDRYETELENVKQRRGTLSPTYIILIGRTGSGKSSFIEAVSSNSTRKPLGIAKDQLESVTQEACMYEVKNLRVRGSGKIYIVDTPGFADPKISEFQVLDKITYWRDRCQQSNGRIRLLYFHSITDIRMPASRKQCIDIVHRFWGTRVSTRATLVTSMWDRVPERCKNASEQRFRQLSTDHWGDWLQGGSLAFKFENTFESAMMIINTLCVQIDSKRSSPYVKDLGMEGTAGNPVYEALSSRLSSLEQKRATLLEDLALPGTQGQTGLISILTRDLNQTELLLRKFSAEMDDFLKRYGPPQDSPQNDQTLVDAEVIHAAPTATDTVNSNPGPIPADVPFVPPEDSPQIDHTLDTKVTDTAPTAIDALDSNPGPTSAVVVDPVVTETDSAAPVTNIPNMTSTASGSADPATTRVAEVIQPQKASRLNQLSQWVHKKTDKIHFGRRKGA